MVKNNYILIFLVFIHFFVNSQESIEDIFNKNEDTNFYDIITKADNYFLRKHPNKNMKQLSEGEFRDGEFVKYMRWKLFWKTRHTKDGKLSDPSKARKEKKKRKNKNPNGSYGSLQWNNISYDEDLGSQIGLGRTNSIAFHPTDPNTFYVGSANGGIWKTVDGGNTYLSLGDNLPYMSVSSISIDKNNPDIIYIAISDRIWHGPSALGVYKSTDGGISWNPTSLTFNFSDNIRIYWIEQDPNNSNIYFLGTDDGLYHTNDGFQTFNKISDGKITDVKFKPGDSNTVYYVNKSGNTFHKSLDGGVTFIKIEDWSGSDYMRIVVTSLNPNKVYVGRGNKLHKSINSGTNFDTTLALEPSLRSKCIVMISPSNENHIYAGFFDMYKSEDGGNTYAPISHWLGENGLPLVHVDMRNAFINPLQDDRIYICNDGGVYSVNVNTDQFTNLSNGLVITQFYDIAVSQTDHNVVSGGSQDNGNVFRESNGSWIKAASTGDGMHQEIDPTNANIRYNSTQHGSIYRFIDGGNRVKISDNITEIKDSEWLTPFSLSQENPNIIIAAYTYVFRSTNQGDSWTKISEPLAEGRPIDLLAVSPSNDERIYAVENYGVSTSDIFGSGHDLSKVFIKDVDSNNWTTVTIPVDEFVEDIVVNPNDSDHIYISLAGYTDNHKVFESIDAGITWKNISGSNLPNLPVGAIEYYDGTIFSNPSSLFIGTDNGMYYKDDTMSDWEKAGVFPNTHIMDIEIQKSNNLIRVGTHGRGILEASIVNSLGVDEIINPLGIYLYPNPASNTLNINITENLMNFNYVIYDIIGKKMKSRKNLDKELNQVNISDLKKGIYFIKIYNEKEMKNKTLKFIKY